MDPLPSLSSLIKGNLQLQKHPSPGCAHSCRVALQDPCPGDESYGVLIASDNKLLGVKVPMSLDAKPIEGRRSLVIPQIVKVSKIAMNGMVFKSEVQSISMVEGSAR